MDHFARQILKSPGYVGRRVDMKPYIRPGIPWHHVKMMQTDNTERSCTLCKGINYGNGTVIDHHSNGLMERVKCPACKGTRIMPKLEGRR